MTKMHILGSCVSRDVFRELGLNEMVEHYSSRMSLHSWISNPVPTNIIPKIIAKRSNWKQKMVYNDMVKEGLSFENVPFLIIDFIQETAFRILEIHGSYITESLEYSDYKLEDHFTEFKVPFERGSREEHDHWLKACEIFREKLQGHDTRLIMHRAFYAHEFYYDIDQLTPFPNEFIKKQNDQLKFYYSTFNEIVKPQHIIDVPAELNIGDVNHKWGLAPFHYIKAYYEEFYRLLQMIPDLRLPQLSSLK